jgi:hemolysin III
VLFTSTAHHVIKNEKRKHTLELWIITSIYLLIAVHIPCFAYNFRAKFRIILFAVVWGNTAFLVLFLKLFFTGRFETFSTLLYLAMVISSTDISGVIKPHGN